MSHHRQHAIGFLATVSDRLVSGANGIAQWEDRADLSALSIADQKAARYRFNLAKFQMIKLQKNVADILVLMLDETRGPEVLDEIRALINSPNNTKYSMSRVFGEYLHQIRVLIVALGVPPAGAHNAMNYGIDGWMQLEFALWHINDARDEELNT